MMLCNKMEDKNKVCKGGWAGGGEGKWLGSISEKMWGIQDPGSKIQNIHQNQKSVFQWKNGKVLLYFKDQKSFGNK